MLTAGERALVRLSAAVAARDPAVLASALAEAARAANAGAVEEVLLQSHLFVGYPVALEAVRAWRAVSGVVASDDGEAERQSDFVARGAAVCAVVYGGQYEKLRANVAELHPVYERWMVEDGYGRVLGRPQLELGLRELCVVGQLVVLGVPRQLYSHLRGAGNAGRTEAAIEEALEIAAEMSTEERATEARAVWSALRERRGRESG